MSDGNGSSTLSPHRPELVSDAVPSRRPRWIELTTSGDHKDQGRLMIGASLAFLVLGLVEFVLMRAQLAVPQNTLIEPITFDRLLSVGQTTLIVLFAVPFAIGLFTYVVPLQIGARGTAFPRLGSFALWLYLSAGAALYVSFAYTPPEANFNALPPLSEPAFISNNGVDVWITSVGLAVLGMTLQALNLTVTLRRMRAPGMAWRRLAPFSFAGAVSSWLLLAVGPLMLAALTMLEIDRHFDGVFFDAGEGGAPIYYQHLSWIFFTGCYVLMLLPAIGAISEIVPTFSGKPLFSRGAVLASMVAIPVLGVLAWMQNMFTASIPVGWLYGAMLMALLLLLPLGLTFYNWLATLAGGAIRLRAPMLFALGAISTLAFGLAGELIQAVIPVNWLLADTVAATAETAYVLVGGSVLGGLAALHYWFPKMTGRLMGESMAGLSLLLILVGVHLTFIPMFLAGLEGQPVDAYRFFEGQGLDTYNLIATIGSVVLSIGILVSVINAARSASRGVEVGPDPWHGETLEWYAPSPPPEHNFDVIPDVRSAEPLRDIRDAVLAREGSSEQAEQGAPVA
ncbi:MAG: cytochrome ubiquinol oxidase subunit I [Solirubrobacterales bacterium]|nr:cytochrome ubiquinol oxidase subunit I [Solirubrobacterales bacterium]